MNQLTQEEVNYYLDRGEEHKLDGNLGNGMEYVKGKLMTEIMAIRIREGGGKITAREVSEKIGMSGGLYSTYETGKRVYANPDRYEEFYYEVSQAVAEIKRERQEAGELIGGYVRLTNELYDEALFKILMGKGVVRTAVDLGIDEQELATRLDYDIDSIEEEYGKEYVDNLRQEIRGVLV